jgi:RNA polymerase sigma-B factor
MVIEGLQVGQAYHSSSLGEMFGERSSAMAGEFMGDLDDELAVIEDREVLRRLLAQLPPRERTILLLPFFCHPTQTQIAERSASHKCASHDSSAGL